MVLKTHDHRDMKYAHKVQLIEKRSSHLGVGELPEAAGFMPKGFGRINRPKVYSLIPWVV